MKVLNDSINPDNRITRPFVPAGTHPIETGRYLIGTVEISRLYEVVTQWIENRIPGGIVYGRPRLGKSRALSFLMHILPADYNNRLSIYDLSSYQSKSPTERSFYEDLLSGVGHDLAFRGSTSEKRVRLVRYLIEQGIRLENRRIVFFMDDAQRLSELQYNCLMDIYNDLDKAGIQLTVILVGQPELLHQRSAFIRTKKTQIVGRFMTQDHEFTGIQNLEDLKYCLTGFDQESEYPVGSGWSFTRYFFPEAFNDGHRLEHEAQALLYGNHLNKYLDLESAMNENYSLRSEKLYDRFQYKIHDEIYWSTVATIKGIASQLRKTVMKDHRLCIKDFEYKDEPYCPYAYAYVFWRKFSENYKNYWEIDNG
jgi:hypothetical protein